ncbi:MAG: DUF1998 domain-containing protein, partial [Chloroflexota bacterium]|nr:DUF1998 domain-containing protein [Chloroflexota bacterium]
MSGQSIRPSQFITTYGPGSILEGPDGPRIIVSLDRSSLFTATRRAADFDITDPRLSQAVLDGAGIVRLPTNAELGVPDSTSIYDTRAFPLWSLCEDHHVLYRYRVGSTRGCLRCLNGPQWDVWSKSRREAIRFVRACPEGHLDEVDWVGMIAHGKPKCRPEYLLWGGAGGALRNIDVQCPDCGESINLGTAYARDWPCSGRLPETGQQGTGACPRGTRPASIVQRGAANLRVPDLASAITIPPLDTPLHRILSRPVIRGILVGEPDPAKDVLVQKLRQVVQLGLIPASDPLEVAQYTEADIQAAIRDISGSAGPASVESMRIQEFRQLQRAAVHGAPAIPSKTPGQPPLFEVIRDAVRTYPRARRSLRVTPVSRLQVIMVQLGYRRIVGDGQTGWTRVPVSYFDGQRTWYPGVELFGEGVFIDLANADGNEAQHFALNGSERDEWQRAWFDPVSYGREPDDKEHLHPIFVWWHTLAHRLLNALSIDSGYSSAALRERVYLQLDEKTGQGRGGVLLYTAQPGGDGTLGGLISLVPHF